MNMQMYFTTFFTLRIRKWHIWDKWRWIQKTKMETCLSVYLSITFVSITIVPPPLVEKHFSSLMMMNSGICGKKRANLWITWISSIMASIGRPLRRCIQIIKWKGWQHYKFFTHVQRPGQNGRREEGVRGRCFMFLCLFCFRDAECNGNLSILDISIVFTSNALLPFITKVLVYRPSLRNSFLGMKVVWMNSIKNTLLYHSYDFIVGYTNFLIYIVTNYVTKPMLLCFIRNT